MGPQSFPGPRKERLNHLPSLNLERLFVFLPGKVDARCFESFFWLLGSSQSSNDFIFFSDGVGWTYPRDLSFVMISQYHEVVETRCLRFHVETSTGKKIDESPTVSSSQGSGVILLMEQNPAPLRMPQMLG